jgi:PleD family two-component response regulator
MQNIREKQVPHSGSPSGLLTVSIGIASLDPKANEWGESIESLRANGTSVAALDVPSTLLKIADQALYSAKQTGRSKAVLGQGCSAVS